MEMTLRVQRSRQRRCKTFASHRAGTVGRISASSLGRLLDLHQIAWDVYLVYKPGIKWEGPQPPRPTFWMHQLEGADRKLLLCENPTRLNSEVGKLLEQMN